MISDTKGEEVVHTIASIKEAIRPIALEYGLKRVYLFGSYAKGTANEESDVDLLIEKGSKLTLLGMSGILQDVKEALKLPVDLISVGGVSEEFRKEIEKSEILIYEQ